MNRMSFLPAVLVGALSLGISTGAFAVSQAFLPEEDFTSFLGTASGFSIGADDFGQTLRPRLDRIEANINTIQQQAVKNALQAKLSAAKASIQKDVNSIKASAQSLKNTVTQIQTIQESLKKAAALQATQKNSLPAP